MRGKVLRWIDTYAGTALYGAARLAAPFLAKPPHEKNILVIKLWAIGESVMLLPFLKELHARGYAVTIVCTAQNKAVFEGQACVRCVHVFSPGMFAVSNLRALRATPWLASVDAEPYTKFSAVIPVIAGATRRIGFANRALLYTETAAVDETRHMVELLRRLFSRVEPMSRPGRLVPIMVSETEKRHAAKWVKPGANIVLHAGSAGSARNRRWPEEKWASLIDQLGDAHVILIGAGEEKAINERISTLTHRSVTDLTGKLSLHELAALMASSQLVIANDSGPMHIAAAMGVPTIGLFGPNIPARFGPYGPRTAGIRRDRSPPCIRPFRRKFPECGHDHMNRIRVEDVMRAVGRLGALTPPEKSAHTRPS